MTTIDEVDLRERGFEGFVPFSDLPLTSVPNNPGIYVVLRQGSASPVFLETSPGGWFKGKDPSASLPILQAKWIPEAQIVYVGKADAGAAGRRGLKKRLDEFRRFGAGEAVGHWGGRYIWQLAGCGELLVAWKSAGGTDPAAEERRLMDEFKAIHGLLPFANLRY
jgi:hypothetical protein